MARKAAGRAPLGAGMPLGTYSILGWFLAAMCLLVACCFSAAHYAVVHVREERHQERENLESWSTPAPARAEVLDAAAQVAPGRLSSHEGSGGSKHQKVLGEHVLVKHEGGTDVELVYQTPERALGKATEGMIVLAHGCSHSATDFFDHGPLCPRCIGLPIERNIVAKALERGLTVVAVSSFDQLRSKCWHPHVDAERIIAALQHVKRAAGLPSLPVLALGASSGGSMVHELGLIDLPDTLSHAGRTRLAALAVQIMPIGTEEVDAKYPPAILWHMPRDRRSAEYIKKAVAHLKAMQRPVLELRCDPQTLHPEFFSDWIPALSSETSVALVSALRAAHMIDEQGFLVRDPRSSDWRRELTQRVPAVTSQDIPLTADASGVSEMLNVAWAQHEFCAQGLSEALDFLTSFVRNCSSHECSTR